MEQNVPATTPQADFFVSYTAVDECYAEWIAWCLEQEGHKVIFAKWDFRPGNNFVLMMDFALKVAKQTLVVLSPAYIEAYYTRPEWATVFAEDALGLKRKLIPVRVYRCEPEGLLKSVIYIDLVEFMEKNDKDGARLALMEGIRSGRLKPLNEPAFPGSDVREERGRE